MNALVDIIPDIDVWAIPVDDLEGLQNAGEALAQANDRNRWKLGDLALRVTTRYGDDEFGSYAGRIKVFYKTLYSYRQVSAFYPDFSIRVEFPNLCWSHYRMCTRLKDYAAAAAMLSKASAKDWSAVQLTDALNLALGRPPVRRVIELEAVAVDGYLNFSFEGIEDGHKYAVKIYAAEEAE